MAASSVFQLAGQLVFGSRAKGRPGWWSRANMAGYMAITAPRSLMRVGFLKILGFRFGGRQHDESPSDTAAARTRSADPAAALGGVEMDRRQGRQTDQAAFSGSFA